MTQMAADLYDILGVERSASQPMIKKAYRQIARKYHPDKNPGDEKAANIFSSAAEAYRILGDVELRVQYDRHGKRPATVVADRSAEGERAPEDPADVFREIFGTSARGESSRSRSDSRPRAGPSGQGRAPSSNNSRRKNSDVRGGAQAERRPYSSTNRGRGRPTERGDDLRYVLDLRLEDLAFGCEKTITVPRKEKCSHCAGTGAQAGSAPVLCQTCGGSGERMDESGFFSTRKKCDACEGAGKLVGTPCRSCAGLGLMSAYVSIPLTVPEGIEMGTRLRIKDEGELGKGGGPRGDLFVVVQMLDHPFFKREDNDVVVEVPVRFDQASMGATIEVPTLEGRVRMRVPPGSQSGREFRLKGKGFPSSSSRSRGDQRVRVLVEVPAYLSEEQTRLIQRFGQLDAEHSENPLVRDYLRALDDYFS
jgi:molecular chaperone DnaJ